jgi:hypothetical protein
MHRVLPGQIERGDMPDLVALVARGEDVHMEMLGTLAFGDSAPMKRDTIFRIASITKIVVAVAAMILMEDCKFRLDDAIDTQRMMDSPEPQKVYTDFGRWRTDAFLEMRAD